jgi:hypothetical protein
MSAGRKSDVRVRTPSSAMLVQMLFVLGALGTGAIGALVTWLGPRDERPTEKASEEKVRDEGD